MIKQLGKNKITRFSGFNLATGLTTWNRKQSRCLQEENYRPDVAIWGITNPRSAVTLKRIALACVENNLRTAILWTNHKGRAALTPKDYDIQRVEFIKVPIRFNYSILHYPRPIVLPLLQNDVNRALKLISPRCIMTQLDHGQVDRVWQHVAHKMGIPGIVIQEGMTNVPKESLNGWSLKSRRRWSWGERSFTDRLISAIPHPLLEPCAPYMFADYVCVWGKVMKEHLLHLGRDEETIFVTGSPAFDHVTSRAPLKPSNGRTVLYAQQRMGIPLEDRTPFYEQIIRVVTKDLGCRLLFKLHPNSFSEANHVRALAHRIGCPSSLLKVIDKGDAVDLLSKASVVLVATSTTAYHAALAGIPLVVLDYCSRNIRFNVGGSGGAAVVRSPEDLRERLYQVIFDESFRKQLYIAAEKLVHDHLFALDGRSSGRVAEVVKQLLRNSGDNS